MYMYTGNHAGMYVYVYVYMHMCVQSSDYMYMLCLECHSRQLINPRHACAARVTVVVLCVCLSVCLFVYDYSRTTGYEAAYERYQQLQCY